jgi:hypothetical protein
MGKLCVTFFQKQQKSENFTFSKLFFAGKGEKLTNSWENLYF